MKKILFIALLFFNLTILSVKTNSAGLNLDPNIINNGKAVKLGRNIEDTGRLFSSELNAKAQTSLKRDQEANEEIRNQLDFSRTKKNKLIRTSYQEMLNKLFKNYKPELEVRPFQHSAKSKPLSQQIILMILGIFLLIIAAILGGRHSRKQMERQRSAEAEQVH